MTRAPYRIVRRYCRLDHLELSRINMLPHCAVASDPVLRSIRASKRATYHRLPVNLRAALRED